MEPWRMVGYCSDPEGLFRKCRVHRDLFRTNRTRQPEARQLTRGVRRQPRSLLVYDFYPTNMNIVNNNDIKLFS